MVVYIVQSQRGTVVLTNGSHVFEALLSNGMEFTFLNSHHFFDLHTQVIIRKSDKNTLLVLNQWNPSPRTSLTPPLFLRTNLLK